MMSIPSSSNQDSLSQFKSDFHEEKSIPSSSSTNDATQSRKELLKIAKDMFSEPLYLSHSKENKSSLAERCKKVLEKNLEEARNLKDVDAIAHFVFKRYVDEEVDARLLPSFYEKHPEARKLDDMDSDLRKHCHIRSRMYHSIAIEKPILAAIKEKFPELDCSNVKINLAAVR